MCSVCKCILLGDSRVGKTTFLQNILSETRIRPTETIGIDFRFLPGFPQSRVMVWDISGRELFRPIIKPHYRNTHVAFVLYDESNRASFQNVAQWVQDYQQYATPTVLVLVGNRRVPTRVTPEEGQALATQLGMRHVRVDVKVDAVLPWVTDLIQKVLQTFMVPDKPVVQPVRRGGCFQSWLIQI